MATTNIGTFYQGSLITIGITPNASDTDEQKAVIANNDVYLGIYSKSLKGLKKQKVISTVDGTLTKTTAEDGTVTISGAISPMETKSMRGEYVIEMLIKNSDNSFSNPCENLLEFTVEPRMLPAEVIEDEEDDETESDT